MLFGELFGDPGASPGSYEDLVAPPFRPGHGALPEKSRPGQAVDAPTR